MDKLIFPLEKQEKINGEDYITMSPEVFRNFFVAVTDHGVVDKDHSDELLKEYDKALTHKKKRISMKKLKNTTHKMVNALIGIRV